MKRLNFVLVLFIVFSYSVFSQYGDKYVGNDANNERFILHGRSPEQGDYFQITYDVNGSWQWNNGFYLKRSNGYFGLNNALPIQLLDVNGRVNVRSGVIQNGTTAITTTEDLGLYSTRTGFHIRIVSNQAPIRFFTDGDVNPIGQTSRLTINNNGYVGIGTDNPQMPLHVTYGMQIGTSTTANQNWHIGSDQWNGVWALRFYNGNQGSGTNVLTLTNNGIVGINTGLPADGSIPNLKLAVNGTIKAKEIKVTNSNWADFVFKPGYNLRNLNDVENYIKENGHLPEIPNEQEVTENGIMLGDMTAKLLMKIEELTLYIIQQQKEIECLKAEINK